MTVLAIAGIFLLLTFVAGFLFVAHSLEKRKQHRARLVTALKARRNAFKDLSEGFPSGFLPNDLTALLYRGIIDCCEQLLQLEPKEASHAETLAFYTNALGGIKASSTAQRTRLESAQQIKDAHQLLQELARFVQQQAGAQKINGIQLEAYTDQINRLLLQLTVDSHLLSAKMAQQAGKTKLVIHHYTLARKALASDNGHHFKQHIAKLDAAIATLQASLAPKDTPSPDEENPLATNKEWKEFDEENEKWRRKQIYDE